MTDQPTVGGPATALMPVDVLVVGGGVMGLWLLQDLRARGYSPLLVERAELGGEQTCHSHVYLHQGHLYNEKARDLAARLAPVLRLWTEWLTSHAPVRYGSQPSYFGYQNPADATAKLHLWDSLGLNYRRVAALPEPLKGGEVTVVMESPEQSLDGGWLVAELARDQGPWMRRITDLHFVRVQNRRVEEVHVVLPDRTLLRLQPRAVVLAAGASNQALLELAARADSTGTQQVEGVQQIRKAHMLVIRGRSAHLPPLTGVFPELGGLFLVSRMLTASDETVWLVSDDRSPAVWTPAEDASHGTKWWLPRVLASLEALAPRHFGLAQRGRLKWGIYAAPKAEGLAKGVIPHEERIERCTFENLWAVWPTKLTLAPQASQGLVHQIERAVPLSAQSPGQSPPWGDFVSPVQAAPERWQLTQLLAWDHFDRHFL